MADAKPSAPDGDAVTTTSSGAPPDMPYQVWEVVGGGDSGGIVVRSGCELNSAKVSDRLATGASVRELEIRGTRLHFQLLTGTGPAEGWVSIRMKDKDLLVKGRLSLRSLVLKTSGGSRHVKDRYDFDEEDPLGAGGFGSVFLAKSKATDQQRALKVIAISAHPKRSELEAIDAELTALTKLDHPHIMRLYEYFHEPTAIYMVTEMLSGGTFADFFEPQNYLMEHGRLLFRDVVLALVYCHDMGVVHRDLKCDNCLITETDQRPRGKVIDFGVSAIRQRCVREELWLRDLTGTPFYRAPEVLDHSKPYGPKADIWSFGVMLYLALTGEHPFHPAGFYSVPVGFQEKSHIFDSFDMGPLRAEKIPGEAADLVPHLLKVDEASRLDAKMVLESEWLKDGSLISRSADSVALQRVASLKNSNSDSTQALFERACTFRSLQRFERAILRLLAHSLQEREVAELRSRFARLDADNSGTLSKEEIRNALEGADVGLSDEDFEKLFLALDADGTGKIQYTEWLAAVIKPSAILKDSAMKEVFGYFDLDGSGKISCQEVHSLLGDFGNDMLKTADCDEITWEDFKELMQKIASARAGVVSKK